MPRRIRLTRRSHCTYHDAAWRNIPLKGFKVPMFYSEKSGKNAEK
jgi:hypothetical protein